ncbi:type VI secretion system protein TssA [Pseudomonas syringae]|uniref:type VI secretion system protein TssA n=1 Tax=Pseudomonas syringae TaxID=317 RepID=UPI001F1A5306|nr:type VI secretion system protein TssA [Pseudomonas syringae]MCF5709553.1 type VI secretion system protein TssA [Pseudomonas syringae]
MARMDKLSAVYRLVGEQPVSSHDYAGEDIRYSADFETLEAHLNSEHAVLGNGHVDWAKVLELCERILRQHSKDLRVACWLTWALYKSEAFPGLLAGIGLLRYLCENHWHVLYPRKLRTRGAAILWLLPRLEGALAKDVSIRKQLPLFKKLSENLEALDVLLGQYLGEESPLLLPLRRRLSRMLDLASQDEKEPVTIATQVKEVTSQLFSPPSVDNEKEARKALAVHQEITQSLCAWWLRQKATDPRALRLSRTVLWLTIDVAPCCDAEHVTVLRGIPLDRLKNYKERLEQGKYADLIVDLELSIARSPYWLEGQRMVWECLQALGADGATREVEVQLALFLQRVPGIVELRFHDGQPFAEDTTRSWIRSHVMPHVMPPQLEGAPSKKNTRQAWDVVLEEVIPMLPGNGFKNAVHVLIQHLKDASSERARFFWQLGIARLCYRAKRYELARIQLEILEHRLRSAGLEAWESEAFLDVSWLLYRCYEALPTSPELLESKDLLYRRLCQYDFETLLNNQ